MYTSIGPVGASSTVTSRNSVRGLSGQTTTSKLPRYALLTPTYASISYRFFLQVFHTVFIRNIPRMSQKNRTESRRFICLIDTLYDHKIRVIASGEDDYWNLFQVPLKTLRIQVKMSTSRMRRFRNNSGWRNLACSLMTSG